MPLKTVIGLDRDTENKRYEACGVADRFDRNTLLLSCVGQGKKVLELGCSTGYISARLQEAQCQVWAVELDEQAARLARRFCRQVVVADLSQPGWATCFFGATFDVVVLGDVLEHLPDPDEALHRAISLLSPGGCLVISLPNIVHWTQRFKTLAGGFDYAPVGLLDFTHLRFFTPTTARSLIEGAGCRIVHFYPVIGGRFSGRLRRIWQFLAYLSPGLFAYQLLFVATPSASVSHRGITQ